MSAVDQSPTHARTSTEKYLSFNLGRESYAFPVMQIREIIRLVEITPLPQVPPYIRGVINLRGRIIPVVDLRIKFNLEIGEVTDRTCIVVVLLNLEENKKGVMGIVVDSVEEVTNIPVADIEETPSFGTKLDTEFIMGIAKVKGAVRTLLNIDRVISTDTIRTLQEKHKVGKL